MHISSSALTNGVSDVHHTSQFNNEVYDILCLVFVETGRRRLQPSGMLETCVSCRRHNNTLIYREVFATVWTLFDDISKKGKERMDQSRGRFDERKRNHIKCHYSIVCNNNKLKRKVQPKLPNNCLQHFIFRHVYITYMGYTKLLSIVFPDRLYVSAPVNCYDSVVVCLFLCCCYIFVVEFPSLSRWVR